TLTVTGTSGSYVLTDGTDYAALPAGATANQIQSPLATFASIGGTGDVTVTASSTPGSTPRAFTRAPHGLPRAPPTLKVATPITPALSTQLIVSGTSGAYVLIDEKLSDGKPPIAVAANADAGGVQAALGGIIGFNTNNVSVSAVSTERDFTITPAS